MSGMGRRDAEEWFAMSGVGRRDAEGWCGVNGVNHGNPESEACSADGRPDGIPSECQDRRTRLDRSWPEMFCGLERPVCGGSIRRGWDARRSGAEFRGGRGLSVVKRFERWLRAYGISLHGLVLVLAFMVGAWTQSLVPLVVAAALIVVIFRVTR